VAREEGDLNDIHAILGNDKGQGPSGREASFPGRHNHCPNRLELRPSEENNKNLWPVPNLSWSAPQERGSVYGQGLNKNTARRAVGDSLILTTANLPRRRCSKHASPATRVSTIATWSSPVTHLILRLTAERNETVPQKPKNPKLLKRRTA